MDARLGCRVSGALRERVTTLGDPSVVPRALLVLGLAVLGEDVGAYSEDIATALAGVRDVQLRAALAALLNPRSTPVERGFNVSSTPALPHPTPPASGPLAEGDDPFDIGLSV